MMLRQRLRVLLIHFAIMALSRIDTGTLEEIGMAANVFTVKRSWLLDRSEPEGW